MKIDVRDINGTRLFSRKSRVINRKKNKCLSKFNMKKCRMNFGMKNIFGVLRSFWVKGNDSIFGFVLKKIYRINFVM